MKCVKGYMVLTMTSGCCWIWVGKDVKIQMQRVHLHNKEISNTRKDKPDHEYALGTGQEESCSRPMCHMYSKSVFLKECRGASFMWVPHSFYNPKHLLFSGPREMLV